MVEGTVRFTDVYQTPNAGKLSVAVRLRAIRFVVERETAQIAG